MRKEVHLAWLAVAWLPLGAGLLLVKVDTERQ